MKAYKHKNLAEKDLEDKIRQMPHLVEEGLAFITHQRHTGRGPLDLLMVDRDKALIIAELNEVQDDSMLWQGLDYYDYIASHASDIAHKYSSHAIDAQRSPRLLLKGPTFTQGLINHCKWLNV